MRKYFKEFIILSIQLFMFYIFPLFSGPTDAIGMVILILLVTLLLSIILGILSKEKLKYLYPIIIAILFIPTVPIYYNESALVHLIWYLLLSVCGLLLGCILNIIIKKIKKK